MIDKNNLPPSWAIAKLGEVCTYSKGKMPQILKAERDNECSIPYINIKAFEKGIFAEYTNGVKCNLCDDDDLLMVWDGARCGLIGKAKKGAVGSTLMKILPAKNIHKEYLYHFIKSKFNYLNSKPKGVGIPHIEPTLLWNFEFAIAPLPEQQRIVKKIEEHFTDLDKGIEYLKTAQQQLKVYRQSVLKWAFEGKLTNKNIVDGELPKDWETKKLSELCIYVSDGDHLPPPKTGNEIPFITISNIDNNKIDFSDTMFMTEKYYENLKENRKPFKGDILYTVTGSFGIPVLINFEKKFCFQRHIGLIRPMKTINQKWLYYLLQSPQIFRQANKTATGTAQKTVALHSLRNFTIPFCQPKEQSKIVLEVESRLSICDKIEEMLETSLLQAKALRISIIKKGFEGKLVKQNPKDESAEILLAKIRAEIKKNNPDKPEKEVKIKTSKKKKN